VFLSMLSVVCVNEMRLCVPVNAICGSFIILTTSTIFYCKLLLRIEKNDTVITLIRDDKHKKSLKIPKE